MSKRPWTTNILKQQKETCLITFWMFWVSKVIPSDGKCINRAIICNTDLENSDFLILKVTWA